MLRISKTLLFLCVIMGFSVFIAGTDSVHAALGASLSSDNFRVLDPQHAGFGGVSSSSSSSFRLLGTIGDIAIGSSSATNFSLRSGFLYFPKVVAPTLVTATAGDAEVDLIWIAAQALQGLSVSGYNVCTKPSGGSYSCEDVGGVTSYTKSSLINDTAYTFKIEAKDAFGRVIATSNEKSATPEGTGGGGGGSVPVIPGRDATIILEGVAYPDAEVIVLRNSQRSGSVTADGRGNFSFSDLDIPASTHRYSIYAIDKDGRKSALFSFMATAIAGETETVTGLIVPPTIIVSPTSVDVGKKVTVSGMATPEATVLIELLPETSVFIAQVGSSGRYIIQVPTTGLRPGVRSLRARTRLPDERESTYSDIVRFGVGVPYEEKKFETECGPLAAPDFNCDGRVDIVDLSIQVYWYKRALPAGGHMTDLNKDGIVDIVDFSITAFYWTG